MIEWKKCWIINEKYYLWFVMEMVLLYLDVNIIRLEILNIPAVQHFSRS